MNEIVMVIGGGGREAALVWKIAQSDLVESILCIQGNPFMAKLPKTECEAQDISDIPGLIELALMSGVTLVVVGPGDPLAAGIVDAFEEAGIRAFGPSAKAAHIEASKSWAKEFMVRHKIPTADFETFASAAKAIAHLGQNGTPIVVKADGLAAGKGVTVAFTKEKAIQAIQEAMIEEKFGNAGKTVVLEEWLDGEEASIFAFSDGINLVTLASAQDQKRLNSDSNAPNTGGMGAYSPAPVITPELMSEIESSILQPCINGMREEGNPYAGLLYAGLMITTEGPKVVEFNCRFGDPETQVVLPRMNSDIMPYLLACCDGNLANMPPIDWSQDTCLTVVMASQGYPGSYEKGYPITGIEKAEKLGNVMIFHAGTKEKNGALVTNGGRVLDVTARAISLQAAMNLANRAKQEIHWEGAFSRDDIGQKGLKHSKQAQ